MFTKSLFRNWANREKAGNPIDSTAHNSIAHNRERHPFRVAFSYYHVFSYSGKYSRWDTLVSNLIMEQPRQKSIF